MFERRQASLRDDIGMTLKLGVNTVKENSVDRMDNIESIDETRLRGAAQSAARRFKNTWVEFGAVLIRVRDREAWRNWGFESFEAYCAKELHIRQKTAQKLTASYGFLRRHEPDVAASQCRILSMANGGDGDGEPWGEDTNEVRFYSENSPLYATGDSKGEACRVGQRRQMPAFETISVLAGAEERGQLSDADYASLRERIWGEEAASPKLAREVKERFAPPKQSKPVDFQIRRFAQVARKLAEGLAQLNGISDEVRAHSEVLARELEALVEDAKRSEASEQQASTETDQFPAGLVG